MIIFNGLVVRGIGDALSNIIKQKQYFISAGIEERFMKNGTINIDISPKRADIITPDYEIKVDWGRGFKETFRFVKISIIFKAKAYDGYIYRPSRTPHGKNIVEVLSEKIHGIAYGEKIELKMPGQKFRIS